MANILNIGDCIPSKGIFKLYSKFKNVTNFIYNDFVISLVSLDIGSGPMNIVIDNFDFLQAEQLILSENFIVINKEIIKIGNNQIFISKVNLKIDKTEILNNNITSIVNQIVPLLAEKSFSFLLLPARKEIFKGVFEIAICNGAEKASQILAEGKIQEGILLMRGLGSGLTPSGDDFISGMQAALYCINEIYGVSNIEIRENIFKWAKSNNLISNTMIYYNSHGFLLSHLNDFINAFFTFDTEIIKRNIQPLLKVGETSGSDIITGFIFTMINYKFS